MAYTLPTVADFKKYFFRDFPYATPACGNGGDGTDLSRILDADIGKAIAEAAVNFNEGLFGSQQVFTVAFLYLSAHYLCQDLSAASQGVSSSYNWLTTARAVGNVSENYGIPQRIMDSPYFSYLTTTRYGAKYVSLIYPLTRGNVGLQTGCTTP